MLEARDFYREGEDRHPPCDAYKIRYSHYIAGRWAEIDWYIKIGVDPGPPERVLWVESCHD